jgi:hypothetical protein
MRECVQQKFADNPEFHKNFGLQTDPQIQVIEDGIRAEILMQMIAFVMNYGFTATKSAWLSRASVTIPGRGRILTEIDMH